MSLFNNQELEQLREENNALRKQNQALKDHIIKKEQHWTQAANQINHEKKVLHEQHQQQQRENRGAIHQKRRYLEKQKLISEFLKQSGWTIGERTMTYELLTQIAKEWKSNTN